MQPAPSAPPIDAATAALASLDLSPAASAARRAECRICFGEGAELLAFIPCGHRSACADCCGALLAGVQAQRRCPICRAEVSCCRRLSCGWYRWVPAPAAAAAVRQTGTNVARVSHLRVQVTSSLKVFDA